MAVIYKILSSASSPTAVTSYTQMANVTFTTTSSGYVNYYNVLSSTGEASVSTRLIRYDEPIPPKALVQMPDAWTDEQADALAHLVNEETSTLGRFGMRIRGDITIYDKDMPFVALKRVVSWMRRLASPADLTKLEDFLEANPIEPDVA